MAHPATAFCTAATEDMFFVSERADLPALHRLRLRNRRP
jgi:hypothetical protein